MRVKRKPVRFTGRVKRIHLKRRIRRFFRKPFRRNHTGYYIANAAVEETFTPNVENYSRIIKVYLSKFPELQKLRTQWSHFRFLSCSITVTPMSLNTTDHPCGTYLIVPYHGNYAGVDEAKMDRNKLLAFDMVREYGATQRGHRRFVPSVVQEFNIGSFKANRILYRPTLETQAVGSEVLNHNVGILCFPNNTHDMRYTIKLEAKVLFTGQIFP